MRNQKSRRRRSTCWHFVQLWSLSEAILFSPVVLPFCGFIRINWFYCVGDQSVLWSEVVSVSALWSLHGAIAARQKHDFSFSDSRGWLGFAWYSVTQSDCKTIGTVQRWPRGKIKRFSQIRCLSRGFPSRWWIMQLWKLYHCLSHTGLDPPDRHHSHQPLIIFWSWDIDCASVRRKRQLLGQENMV